MKPTDRGRNRGADRGLNVPVPTASQLSQSTGPICLVAEPDLRKKKLYLEPTLSEVTA